MNCPHHPSNNPNDDPSPTIEMEKFECKNSEPSVGLFLRTGLCALCGAAVYGKRKAGSNNLDPNEPLRHAVPRSYAWAISYVDLEDDELEFICVAPTEDAALDEWAMNCPGDEIKSVRRTALSHPNYN